MIAQALIIKQDIERKRAQNMFGILVWQLNEIWPTVWAQSYFYCARVSSYVRM